MSTDKWNCHETELKKCVRCGQCRYVCPVLGEMRKESISPRSKVHLASLLQKDEVYPLGKTDELLSLCLTCGACTAECPSGLPIHKIIVSAREKINTCKPLSPERHFIRNSFKAWPLLTKAPAFPWFLKQVIARGAGLKTGKTALSLLAPQSPSVNTNRKPLRVGYFLGCATNTLLPDVALKTVAVLRHLGCHVVTPSAYCCGLPLETAGEKDLADKILNKNRLLFKDLKLDAIITDCSSCSYHLTEKNFGVKNHPVYEFTEFTQKIMDPPEPKNEMDNLVVAYHEPCHLKYGRKISGYMDKSLSIISGIKKAELPGGSLCCGGAGTFALKNPELSKAILKKNISQIKSSGALQVVTVCPSCTFQIRSQGIEVLHPAQVLYKSYGLSHGK